MDLCNDLGINIRSPAGPILAVFNQVTGLNISCKVSNDSAKFEQCSMGVDTGFYVAKYCIYFF